MVYPSVTNTVLSISGLPLIEAPINIALTGPGFGTDDSHEVISSVTVYTDTSGHWSVPLKPNSLITPSGSYYTITEPGNTIWTAVVPNSAGPFALNSILTVPPTSPVASLGVVRYDTAQSLSSAQQLQAQNNLALSGTYALIKVIDQTVHTTNFTAAANTISTCDSTSAALVGTLPTAPADRTIISLKDVSTAALGVTINCGGSDVFDKPSGGTSGTLKLSGQAKTWQYDAVRSIWVTISDDLPLSQLDARYEPIATLLPSGGDDTAALQTVLNLGGDIILKPGATYKVSSNSGLTMNPLKTRFRGLGTIIDCSAMTSGTALTLTTSTAGDQFVTAAACGVTGLIFSGPGIGSSVTAWSIAGSSTQAVPFTGLGNCYIKNFGTGISEGSYMWCSAIQHVTINACATAIDNSAATANTGERVTYFDLTVAGCYTVLNYPNAGTVNADHYFYSCSFDYNTVAGHNVSQMILTGGRIFFYGLHLEYAPLTTANPISITGQTQLSWYGGYWLVKSPSSVATTGNVPAPGTYTSGSPGTITLGGTGDTPHGSWVQYTAGDTIVIGMYGTGFDVLTLLTTAASGSTTLSVTGTVAHTYSGHDVSVSNLTLSPTYGIGISTGSAANTRVTLDGVNVEGVNTTSGQLVQPTGSMPINGRDSGLFAIAGAHTGTSPTGQNLIMPPGAPPNAAGESTISGATTVTLSPQTFGFYSFLATATSNFTVAFSVQPAKTYSQSLDLMFINHSGGTLGTVTFPGTVSFGAFTWTPPANNQAVLLHLVWSGNQNKWIVQSQSAAFTW